MTIQIRPALAMARATAAIAGAVAATSTDASARSLTLAKAKLPTTRPNIDHACSTKKIFFENCWWNQKTCGGKVINFSKISCPDLR